MLRLRYAKSGTGVIVVGGGWGTLAMEYPSSGMMVNWHRKPRNTCPRRQNQNALEKAWNSGECKQHSVLIFHKRGKKKEGERLRKKGRDL